MSIKSLKDRSLGNQTPFSGTSTLRSQNYFTSGNIITADSVYNCITALKESGEYFFNTLYAGRVKVEFIKIDGDTVYSANTSVGNSTPDESTLIVQYNGNLTINSGATLTPTTRKRGFILHVKGDLVINGSINLTAKGAGSTPGDRLYLVKDIQSNDIELAAESSQGGPGANGAVFDNSGCRGTDGVSGSTGGGGGGGKGYGTTAVANGGAGVPGTSYSGGSGGGAGGHGTAAEPAFGFAGRGGHGSHWWVPVYGGGGAGNPGGPGGQNNSAFGGRKGQDGTGGVLVAFVEQSISGSGSIVSQGSNGANTADTWSSGGGGSGGGGINMFYRSSYNFSGTINTAGGTRGTWASRNYAGGPVRPGGDGGNGSHRIVQF